MTQSMQSMQSMRSLTWRIVAVCMLGAAPWVHAQHMHDSAAAPTATAAPAAPERKTAPHPQLGTGVAFAPDGHLWLAAINEHGRLYLQSAQPQGTIWHWSAPRVLDTGTDDISADGENRPKLIFGAKGVVLVTYTQPLSKRNTGYIRMVRSSDGGHNFAAPITVHADRDIITHRFESAAFDAHGALHTVWIDKRDLEAAPRVGGTAGGKSTYRGAAIYRNVSLDGGATFGPDIKVADHSCECCRIALATGTDGRMRAVWRHVFEPDIRDHAFAVLDVPGTSDASGASGTSGVSQPADIVRATEDDWHVQACPHHGPALVAAHDGGFHLVWFGIRERGGEKIAGVRYGRLLPDGRPDAASVRLIPDARAERPDVLAQGARVAVIWRSTDRMTSTLQAWLSSDGGRSFTQKTLDQVQTANDYPRLVQHGNRMWVVWRQLQEVKTYELTF